MQAYLDAPGGSERCELVRGVLKVFGPASGRHGATGARIGSCLLGYVRPRDLGMVFGGSAGFVTARRPDTVRAPDVSYMSRERIKNQDLDTFIDGAPDLAVEVLSVDDTAAEMRDKMNEYFTAGCRVVWIVDPQQRSVVIHRPDGSPVILTEDDTLTEDELLPGFSLVVREVFPTA